jgi:hypothetical protein
MQHEIARWVDEAMTRAQTHVLADGTVIADVERAKGAWADGASDVEALTLLRDVLFGWAELKIEDGDGDIPVFGLVNLNYSAAGP